MDIAPMQDGDEAAVVVLWDLCGLTRPWNDPARDLALACEAADSVVLIARDDTRICGSIMTGFDGHRGWVYYLAVHPDARHRGLGRALMTAAESWLVDRGAPKVQLMVREDNTDALGFYEALGMTRQAVVTLGRRLD
ncbi:GNAT family acetyltransferase [Brevundimonas sp.]|uniref:GNAT family acetyltransferase n=1 Tax=Brevundimonas sp. TaxID=1871086 RepID=UPI003AF53809